MPNSFLALVIEWGILLISILLVFSPFIYLGIRKWRKHLSVNLWHVIGAYLISFAIYPIWDWWILGKVDRLIYNNHFSYGWLREAFSDAGFRMIFVVGISWPLFVFYSSILIKKRPYSIWHFVTSLAMFISMIYILWKVAMFLIAVGLGYIGRTYF